MLTIADKFSKGWIFPLVEFFLFSRIFLAMWKLISLFEFPVMHWKICSDIVFQILSRCTLLKEYLAFFMGKSAISQQVSRDSFIFCHVKLCGYSSAGVIYCFLEHPPFPRRHCLSPAVTSGKFMKRVDSSICDDVTLFKGNDSYTYCQYFKLKVPNLTLNGYHLDFFLIDRIDKLYLFLIPQSPSSEITKSPFLQVCFAQLTLSSAKEPLLRSPPLHPKAQHGSRTRAQSSHGPHDTSLVGSFRNRFHHVW